MREKNAKSSFIVLIFPAETGNSREFLELSKRFKTALTPICGNDLELIFPSMNMLSLLAHGDITNISSSIESVRPSDCRVLVCEVGAKCAHAGLSNSCQWIEKRTQAHWIGGHPKIESLEPSRNNIPVMGWPVDNAQVFMLPLFCKPSNNDSILIRNELIQSFVTPTLNRWIVGWEHGDTLLAISESDSPYLCISLKSSFISFMDSMLYANE